MKEEKILAVIDTNVIVSALLDHDRESNPSIILDDILSGIITPLYEVAMSMEGTYLVTGNIKHFPINSIVVTPAEMVEKLKD